MYQAPASSVFVVEKQAEREEALCLAAEPGGNTLWGPLYLGTIGPPACKEPSLIDPTRCLMLTPLRFATTRDSCNAPASKACQQPAPARRVSSRQVAVVERMRCTLLPHPSTARYRSCTG